MKQRYSVFGSTFGWALLVFLHLYQVSAIPGLHYDEAWAYNFSWRIASQPGFWPWNAMSPYTSPWAHYWAAPWLRLLGPSLAVYRGSQIFLALGGLALLCFSLPRPARAAFPYACLLLPGLFLNHRFAIELTGLHVLCFGLLCWSIAGERWLLACVAALIGTTAHILFYAVALGWLGAVCLEGFELPRRARAGAMVYFAAAGFFFLQVLLTIPERGKAAALVFSAFGTLGFLALHGERWGGWWGGWRAGWWRIALPVGAAAFVVNAVFFAQGTWVSMLYANLDLLHLKASPTFVLSSIVVSGCLAVGALWLRCLASAAPVHRSAFLIMTLSLGVMMLKPAARYYELVILAMAAIITLHGKNLWKSIEKIKSYTFSKKLLWAATFAFSLALFFHNLKVAVFLPVMGQYVSSRFIGHVTQLPSHTDFHFLFFRDSSRDFLDKQSLVRYLGGSGCGRGDIDTHDPRLKEELDALALGDWPVNQGNCPYAYVALRTEEGATGEAHGEFLLKKRRSGVAATGQ